MANTNIFITFDDLSKLQKDSADKSAVIAILNTEFPDDTCQLLAIKAVLGLIEEEEDDDIDIPLEPSEDEESTDSTEQLL